jgi:cellulose synthase/poly-beta-1,6-N-acetylglucosamine synthase-like glycosyltransferase
LDIRLSKGERVIQGQHIISNPDQGLFPALTWAMFIIDNQFQNLGRTNLGWSAKNMGDSICFRIDILKKIGWGQGLTEDYQLRQKLLLNGIRIAYEPEAIGYGEAPRTWTEAKVQRRRWLRGTFDSSRFSLFNMLHTGINRRDIPLLEGALQALLPSYSTLTIICMLMLIIQGLTNLLIGPVFSLSIIVAWLSFLVVLLLYPMFGLVLTHAPIKAYLAIFSGPFFIIWRTWLALKVRFGGEEVMWDRTAHGVRKISDS